MPQPDGSSQVSALVWPPPPGGSFQTRFIENIEVTQNTEEMRVYNPHIKSLFPWDMLSVVPIFPIGLLFGALDLQGRSGVWMRGPLQTNAHLWTDAVGVTGIFFLLGLLHIWLRRVGNTFRVGHGFFVFQRFADTVVIPGGRVRPGKDRIGSVVIRREFFRLRRISMVYLVEQGAKPYPQELDMRWRPIGWFQDKANADDLAQEIGHFIGVSVKGL